MFGARLVRPSLALGREYLELLRETDRVDIGWNEGPQAKAVEHDLDGHIASLNERAYRIGVLRDRTVARVPQANLWLLSAAGHLVGRVGIRYELDDLLTQHGGHIGYAIDPRWRRQGYG